MAQFEIELRGSLPVDTERNALLKRIESKFGSPLETRELVLFFRYTEDFRFKFIHDSGEFILKKSLVNSSNQEEWITNIPKAQIKSFLTQLHWLGYTEALLSTGTRYVFTLPEYELCIKYDTPIGDFFEIETIVSINTQIPNAEMALRQIAEDLKLYIWNDAEFSEVKSKSLRSLKLVSILNGSKTSLNEEIESFIFT